MSRAKNVKEKTAKKITVQKSNLGSYYAKGSQLGENFAPIFSDFG